MFRVYKAVTQEYKRGCYSFSLVYYVDGRKFLSILKCDGTVQSYGFDERPY
jgi:hypothetical protein